MRDRFTGRAIVAGEKMKFLLKQCEAVSGIEGSVAEIGVFQGGSAKQIATALPDKTLHLFDTFTGIPKANPKMDGHKEGDFGNTSLELVQAFLKVHKNIEFWPGLFPDSTKDFTESEFCLVHVDVDIYSSTRAVVEYFWPLMVPGGIMVFDDYNSPRCRGTNKAVDAFFKGSGVKVEANMPAGTRVIKPKAE